MPRREPTDDEPDLSRRGFLRVCAATGALAGAPVQTAANSSISGNAGGFGTPPATDAIRRRERRRIAERDTSDAATRTPAAVTFSDRSSNGETVTVDSVTIPEDGFVAIHSPDGPSPESVIGVSKYLQPGRHENVEVALFEVPGGADERSRLSEDRRLLAVAHEDTNSTEEFEYVDTDGSADPPYEVAGNPVTDTACITVDNC